MDPNFLHQRKITLVIKCEKGNEYSRDEVMRSVGTASTNPPTSSHWPHVMRKANGCLNSIQIFKALNGQKALIIR